MQLATSAGTVGPMTQEEKERLEELLKDIDEEDTYVDPTDTSEVQYDITLQSGHQQGGEHKLSNLMLYIWRFSHIFALYA